MVKIRHSISFIFLFAILLMLGHSIIPHHHYDDSCEVIPCHNHHSVPEPQNNQAGDPWHCKALSHVVMIEQQLQVKCRNVAVVNFEISGELIQELPNILRPQNTFFAALLLLAPTINFFSSAQLRAPPSKA